MNEIKFLQAVGLTTTTVAKFSSVKFETGNQNGETYIYYRLVSGDKNIHALVNTTDQTITVNSTKVTCNSDDFSLSAVIYKHNQVITSLIYRSVCRRRIIK